MGFFSWKTQDTKRSIANIYSNHYAVEVTMTDNKGNKWLEKNYEGYGVFGGKDYYQLLAEMNKPKKCTGDLDADRSIGIRLEYGISAIKNKKTGKMYKAHDIDYFNWDSHILPHGLSANDSVETGEWDSITIKEDDVIYPNLTENPDHKWSDKKPPTCDSQGYFYGEDNNNE